MARFLIALLHGAEDAIPAIELQAAENPELPPEQRTRLLDLQTRYENFCHILRELINQHQ
jgi:hypothetical protein